MIIQNGYIEFKFKTGGGFDANGYPVKAQDYYGEKIPCQFMWSKRDLLASSNGNPIISTSYEVLVAMPLPEAKSEQLRLSDMEGATIGEFSVISFQHLRAVQEVKIII